MRCGRGSTREYAQSNDFEPRARRSGAPARQAGGAATRVAQPPQPHNPSNSQHTATAHPRRLLGSAPNSVEISSIGGTTGPQRIGALRSLDPRQSLKTSISGTSSTFRLRAFVNLVIAMLALRASQTSHSYTIPCHDRPTDSIGMLTLPMLALHAVLSPRGESSKVKVAGC